MDRYQFNSIAFHELAFIFSNWKKSVFHASYFKVKKYPSYLKTIQCFLFFFIFISLVHENSHSSFWMWFIQSQKKCREGNLRRNGKTQQDRSRFLITILVTKKIRWNRKKNYLSHVFCKLKIELLRRNLDPKRGKGVHNRNAATLSREREAWLNITTDWLSCVVYAWYVLCNWKSPRHSLNASIWESLDFSICVRYQIKS